VAIVTDARLLETESVRVGAPAGCHQKMAPAYRLLAHLAAHNDVYLCARAFDPHHGAVMAQADLLARKLIEHHGCAFGILARERLRHIEDGHRSAEPAVGLRKLESNR